MMIITERLIITSGGKMWLKAVGMILPCWKLIMEE